MKNPRVSFVSLGCAKNLVDSEVLLGHLAKGGFDLYADYMELEYGPRDCDYVFINLFADPKRGGTGLPAPAGHIQR